MEFGDADWFTEISQLVNSEISLNASILSSSLNNVVCSGIFLGMLMAEGGIDTAKDNGHILKKFLYDSN